MRNLILANHKIFRLKPSASAQSIAAGKPQPIPDITNLDTTNTSISLDHSRQIVYYVDNALNFRAYHLLTQRELLCTPLITEIPEGMEEDEDLEELLLPGDRIVNVQYVQENEAVVIIASNDEIGQIISISTAGIVPLPTVDGTTAEGGNTELNSAAMSFFTPVSMLDGEEDGEAELGGIEVIGQIEGGFSSATWSPDRELLVLGCNNGNLIVMSNQYDVIGETPITGQVQQQQQLAQSNPYVHLSGTIQHKEYNELTKANQLIHTDAERDIGISWRGDSQYFVTNSLKQQPNGEYVRYLRVWSRQCQLTSQSEPLVAAPRVYEPVAIDNTQKPTDNNAYNYHQGYSHHLAWRPSGNIIATLNTTRTVHGNTGVVNNKANTGTVVAATAAPQYLIQQHVQFYERNGLPRYSFPLHEPTLPGKHSGFVVLDMQWNPDSTVLTISMYDLYRKSLVIKCFTTKNYHWYCKYVYTLPINVEQDELTSVKFLWQYNRHTRLIILSNNTTVHCLDLVDDGYQSSAPLYTSVVTDGRVLGLTHFSRAAIPPPLSSRQVLFHTEVNNVHICNTIDPRTITYENSCIQSTPDMHYKITTASTNGMRMDIVSPMVVLTANNELLFVTDAVEFNNAIIQQNPIADNNADKNLLTTMTIFNAAENTIKPTVFAPEYQPERQQALGRAVSTAKPMAFGAITLQQILAQFTSPLPDDEMGLYYWRHVQWVYCQQWRDLLINFTLSNQKDYIESGAQDGFMQYLLQTNKIQQKDLAAQTNVVTVVQTAPNSEYDVLVIIAFTFDMIYDITTKVWVPKVDVQSVNTKNLNPLECQEIIDASPEVAEANATAAIANTGNETTTTTAMPGIVEENTTTTGEGEGENNNNINGNTMSSGATEICQHTISRVFVTPHSKAYPIAPEPPVPEETQPTAPPTSGTAAAATPTTALTTTKPTPQADPVLDLEWYQKHDAALQSPPLLNLLTSYGHVIQIPITLTDLQLQTKTTTSSNSITKNNNGLICRKNQLPPDCLYFMVASMYGDIVYIGLDQQQRLLINHTVIAPQCMSFNMVQFSDVQAYPLPPTAAYANISLQQTGHGQIPTYVSNQQLSQVTTAMKAIPQGLFPAYLLVTVASQQHALFTVDLHKCIDDNINPMSLLRQDPNMVRVVEKGAKLVQCIPDILRPRVIVQQPRGNIEVITPRSLGLTSIFCALLCKQYNIAFRSLRTNKIDLNLLIDHNKEEFIQNIVTILQELYLPDNITLLLSSLTNEDCTAIPPTTGPGSNVPMQYPRYHEMFTTQTTMKRLMNVYIACQQAIKNNNNNNNTSNGLTLATPQPTLLQVVTAANSNDYSAVLTKLDADMTHVDYADLMATPRSPITGQKEQLIVNFGNQNNDKNKNDIDEEKVKELSVIEQYIANGHSEQPPTDVDGFDFNAPSTAAPNSEDLDTLRKQLQLKKLEQVEKRRQNNNAHLKSTAQSFSNRTRVHKQMGNDTTNDNNKYESTLGEEAGMKMLADGSGQTYQQQLSRVEHWGTGEMDVRHVYSSAERLIKMYNGKHGVGINTVGPIASTNNNNTQEQQTTTPTTTSQQEDIKKINQICDVVLNTLNNVLLTPQQSKDLQQQRQQYLLSILTAHLRKSPPDFVAAMNTLQTTAKQESSVSNKINVGSTAVSISTTPRQTTLGPRPVLNETTNIKLSDFGLPTITAEKALKYMLILADKDELWKAALSTYNLTLSQSVAEHSGRDPKEYIPFLTTLANILQFGPAMTNLQTSRHFVITQYQEVMQYIKKVNPTLGNNFAMIFDEEMAETPPNTQELNQIPLPHELGVHLQHAYIDIYLKQYTHVIAHYYKAVQSILKLFTYQLKVDPETQEIITTDEELCTTFNVKETTQIPAALIKYGFILQSIYKLVLNYIQDYPYLYHFVIHLFCSPLPQAVAVVPQQQNGGNIATQPKIPQLTKDIQDVVSTWQYKMLHGYALFLVENKQYNDAAYIYLHLGHINDAVTSWANAGEYRNVLIYIQRYPYLFAQGELMYDVNKNDITTTQHHTRVQIYTKLVNVLIETQRNYKIAAQIQFYQLQAPMYAISTLFQYKEWKEAMLFATNYLTSGTTDKSFDEIFTNTMKTHLDKELTGIKQAMEQYRSAVERLRLVRLVKQLIFGAQANNAQCIAIYNKGAVELGNVSGLIPKPNLVLRIPNDDVLEFIITGCWRGVQTGLDINGEGFVGSVGGLSTATGVSLISLAPSIAQSIQSLSSAFSGQSGMSQVSHGRLSNGSALSTGQGSMLSLGAAETALTADERRLKKHMSKIKSKQSRKKVKGGDPREEEKLMLEIAYLTPRDQKLAQWYELIDVCALCGEQDKSNELLTLVGDYIKLIKKEETTPMYVIETFSTWQQNAIKECFNWPQSVYLKDEEEVSKEWLAKLKEENDDKLKQELSHMSKQQKLEWDRLQSAQLQKQLHLHVYQQPVPNVASAAMLAGDHLQKEKQQPDKNGATKDKHRAQQQNHHQGPITLEQVATENAQQQTWKNTNPTVAKLCQTLPTINLLTRPINNNNNSSQNTTTIDNDIIDPNAINMYDILLDQILNDLKSTSRRTQLRMNHNPFGQKSLSQKLLDDQMAQ